MMSVEKALENICNEEGCGQSQSEMETHRQQHFRRQMDIGLLACDKSPKLHGFTDQTPTPSKLFDDKLIKTPSAYIAMDLQNPFDQEFEKVWLSLNFDTPCLFFPFLNFLKFLNFLIFHLDLFCIKPRL